MIPDDELDEEVQFKDISFRLSKFGQIETSVQRGGWTVPTTNDLSEPADSPQFKPSSLGTPDNDFTAKFKRQINFKPNFKGQTAGNMTLFEFDKYMFIFDMKLQEEFRGKGGGSLLADLFKATLILAEKDWAGGFVGDGNTLGFLQSQGFERAEFETWTDRPWGSDNVSGSITLDKDYYNIPGENRFGFSPSPADIEKEFYDYVIQASSSGRQWTRNEEKEQRVTAGVGAPLEEGKIVFNTRVRQDVALDFWNTGWSTWFKIPTRQIEFEDRVFPIANRSAPVLDRFRDPTFTIF